MLEAEQEEEDDEEESQSGMLALVDALIDAHALELLFQVKEIHGRGREGSRCWKRGEDENETGYKKEERIGERDDLSH